MKEIYLIYRNDEYLNVNNTFSTLGTDTAFFESYESANNYAKDIDDVSIRGAFIGLGEFYNAN